MFFKIIIAINANAANLKTAVSSGKWNISLAAFKKKFCDIIFGSINIIKNGKMIATLAKSNKLVKNVYSPISHICGP